MNVEHKILQVGVNAGLCVYGGLFIRQQVVKLDDAYRNGLKLLGLEHHLFQTWILYDLIGDDRSEMTRFSNVPPVITVERCV